MVQDRSPTPYQCLYFLMHGGSFSKFTGKFNDTLGNEIGLKEGAL